MATADVNGVRLFYELSGSGEIALVVVHGSWGSHDNWERVVPGLAKSFRVLAYDLRGHSPAPAWVAGNSFGGAITLRLAGDRSDLFGELIAHEPPIFSLLGDDPTVAPFLDSVGKKIRAGAIRGHSTP